MTESSLTLKTVFDGWDGYQASLLRAIEPRSREELAYRPAPHLSSVGEIARHISFGRIDWFNRMKAPGSAELASRVAALSRSAGEAQAETDLTENAAALVRWLEVSWKMIEDNLTLWTVDDLGETYTHPYQGKNYAISRQWTIWRIMAHDIHHGGQLTIILWEQGIQIHELGFLGGHITEPPLARTA